jgi:drug/metabolite transporter (DMT)-like permease
LTTPDSGAGPGADRLRALGVGAAAVAVAVWGTSTVLIKLVDDVSGLGIGFYRLVIGASALVVVHLARGGTITLALLRACFAGGVAFGLDIILFFTAVQETTIANATVIGALQPILVMALAPRLFGEHPRVADLLLGAVAIGGCVIVVTGAPDDGVRSLYGDLLATTALFAWTWYFVASKRARRTLGSFEYLVGLSIVAVVVLLPFALVSASDLGTPSAEGWLIIAAIAGINGALGHILMNWAHAHVPIVVTSLLTLAIPVFAATAAWAFVDERITGAQVAGTAVVIGSLSVVVLHQARSAAVAPEPAIGADDMPPG